MASKIRDVVRAAEKDKEKEAGEDKGGKENQGSKESKA
jgi:hypothetical protein